MNIISLEAKFKNIEKKENNVNNFFNPFNGKGPKHYCIKDIFNDFEYDSLLYGLSKFYQFPEKSPNIKDAETIDSPSFTKKTPVSPVALTSKISQNNLTALNKAPNLQESMPKLKKFTVKPLSPTKVSKLHDPILLQKYKNIEKNEYRGAFSTTRVVNRQNSPLKIENSRASPLEWKPTTTNNRVSNKSALDHIESHYEKTDLSNITLHRKNEKFKPQIHPTEGLLENNYKEKPHPKFRLTPEIKKNQEKLPQEKKNTKWFEIKYSNSPIFESNSNGIVTITLLNASSYPNLTFVSKENEKFYLPDINWLQEWKQKTVRIQINSETFQEFYLHFGHFSEENEKKIGEIIEKYLYSIAPEYTKSTISPLTLKRISENSPIRSKSSIKLPALTSKNFENANIKYINPVTKGLINYRESLTGFNPMSFPANLTIFELHDFLESRYKKIHKEKESNFSPTSDLEVEGKRVRMV